MVTANERAIPELYLNDKAEEVSIKTDYKRMVEPVVVIYTLSGNAVTGSGTAFAAAYDKKADETYFLSNNHVCSPTFDTLFVGEKLNDSQASFTFDGHPDLIFTIVDVDPANDLCLLKASGFHQPVRINKKNEKLEVAQRLFVVGAPNSNAPIILETFFSGYVSRSALPNLGMTGTSQALMISEMLQPGHSGSPIFNKKGELVGIGFASSVRDRVDHNTALFSYGGLGIGLPDILKFLEKNGIK